MDDSPPASSDHGIPQARACVSLWLILIDVWQKTIQFWKAIILQLKKFFFKEYWSGLPFPSPGDLPDPGIELRSPALQVDALPAELLRKPRGTAEGKPNGVLCPGSFLLILGGRLWMTFPKIVLLCKSCLINITSDQFSSVAQLCPTLCDPWIAACLASLSITNCRSLLKLMAIESVMPSSHLILCHPLLLLPPIPPSIRVFSNESTLCSRWPEYWSFSFSISPSNEHPGLISFTNLYTHI